ncbi:hypothetical protein F5Y08DRAFT_127823 [Xylaria arbuscula]|nr:hypothetical protein F5Y08DRAFT_127823 [Xylaria arbuscula]
MFTLPQAKRVRREDINDSASDSLSSEDEGGHNPQVESALRAKLSAQLSGLLNLNFSAGAAAQQQQQVDQAKEQSPKEEEAFAFRLFRDEAPTHTVVLTHDEGPAGEGEGGFIVPSRPRSHYIASAPSSEKETEYRSVAVSAEYLLADSKKRRCGLEKPWRVIHISPSSSLVVSSSSSVSAAQSEGKEKKRTRPGKKHRLLLRVREKAKREREEAAKKLAIDKEQHLQEKKKRLNRERKLKRRQKEREKKAALQTTDHDGGGTNDGPQKSDDDEASVS